MEFKKSPSFLFDNDVDHDDSGRSDGNDGNDDNNDDDDDVDDVCHFSPWTGLQRPQKNPPGFNFSSDQKFVQLTNGGHFVSKQSASGQQIEQIEQIEEKKGKKMLTLRTSKNRNFFLYRSHAEIIAETGFYRWQVLTVGHIDSEPCLGSLSNP